MGAFGDCKDFWISVLKIVPSAAWPKRIGHGVCPEQTIRYIKSNNQIFISPLLKQEHTACLCLQSSPRPVKEWLIFILAPLPSWDRYLRPPEDYRMVESEHPLRIISCNSTHISPWNKGAHKSTLSSSPSVRNYITTVICRPITGATKEQTLYHNWGRNQTIFTYVQFFLPEQCIIGNKK